MYHNYSQEELRAYCRSSIESLELWARRLIHEKMVEKYGYDYIDVTSETGEWIIKKEIRDRIHNMMEKNPERFSRAVDTFFLDDIIYCLCNQQWYKELFKSALDHAFPQGCEEAREYLRRLIPIRNALAHANTISVRQAEQAICYSHDFVQALMEYYKEIGKDRTWNIPRILRLIDSCGNEIQLSNERDNAAQLRLSPAFYVGDSYSVQIEVDPAFSAENYSIIWYINHNKCEEFSNNPRFIHSFSMDDIGQYFVIKCIIISDKEWHKYKSYDDCIEIFASVAPTE